MDNAFLFFLIFGFSNRSPILDTLMIWGAEYVIYFALILMFTLAVRGGKKERKALLLSLVAFPIIILLIKFIHIFYNLPRPYVNFHFDPLVITENNATFPSRHTSIMSVIFLSYLLCKSKWSNIFAVFLIWVGISRIYVGVHYPLDIIGGIITGALSLFIALFFTNLFKAKT